MRIIDAIAPQNATQVCFFGGRLVSARHGSLVALAIHAAFLILRLAL